MVFDLTDIVGQPDVPSYKCPLASFLAGKKSLEYIFVGDYAELDDINAYVGWGVSNNKRRCMWGYTSDLWGGNVCRAVCGENICSPISKFFDIFTLDGGGRYYLM